jgi:hypothetical protein
MYRLLRLVWLPAVTFFLGVAVALFWSASSRLAFKGELDVGDALDMVVTLLLALLLQWYFTKSFSEVRAEREMLIAQVREVQAAAAAARQAFLDAFGNSPSEASDQKIVASLRMASVQLTALERACDTANGNFRTESSIKTRQLLREYKALISDRAFNLFKPYDQETYEQSENVYARLMQELLVFSIQVNRGD